MSPVVQLGMELYNFLQVVMQKINAIHFEFLLQKAARNIRAKIWNFHSLVRVCKLIVFQ